MEIPLKVRVEIKIVSECREPRIFVLTDRFTEEISALVKKLSGDSPQFISGFREERLHLLELNEIHRLYAASQFVCIPHSEIINILKVKNIDLNFQGIICITLKYGTVSFVSRRYVNNIKHLLGL